MYGYHCLPTWKHIVLCKTKREETTYEKKKKELSDTAADTSPKPKLSYPWQVLHLAHWTSDTWIIMFRRKTLRLLKLIPLMSGKRNLAYKFIHPIVASHGRRCHRSVIYKQRYRTLLHIAGRRTVSAGSKVGIWRAPWNIVLIEVAQHQVSWTQV